MSSVISEIAQISRRIGYFRCLGDVSGYNVAVNVADYNSWTASPITGNSAVATDILQDMGEMAKVSGQILRKVRKVTQVPAGGIATPFWIVVPGGEYPDQGVSYSAAGALLPAAVARLG